MYFAEVAYSMEITKVIYFYLDKVTWAILHDYSVPLQHYVRYVTSWANKNSIALYPPILYRLYYKWLHHILHYPKT